MGARAASEMGNRCNSTDKDIEGKTSKIQQDANGDEFTVVLLEVNGNPGQTFQLKQNLQQLLPQALREQICKHTTLPDSWGRKYLIESDLVLSIGDAAISDEMSLHQNGVTDGTVITVPSVTPFWWRLISSLIAASPIESTRSDSIRYLRPQLSGSVVCLQICSRRACGSSCCRFCFNWKVWPGFPFTSSSTTMNSSPLASCWILLVLPSISLSVELHLLPISLAARPH